LATRCGYFALRREQGCSRYRHGSESRKYCARAKAASRKPCARRRATVIDHRHLLLTRATTDSIASREGCSARKVNMTISLAFLAPDLVKAAIDGRLPHGMGVARLTDLPAEWSRQREMLGFPAH